MTQPARYRRAKEVEQLASEAFAEHEIHTRLEQDVYRHYDCRHKNGSNIYQFHVVTFPGRLIVSGDIGDLMLVRCYDMLEWAPQAVESIDYFASKVVSGPTKQYCSEVAREAIRQARQENPLDLLEVSDVDNPHSTIMEIYDSRIWEGCDFPSLENWTSNFLWCREALRWFFRNHPQFQTSK